MSRNNVNLQLGSASRDNQLVQDIDNTYTVPSYIRRVEAKTTSANNAFTITVAPPGQCIGQHVTVYMTARNSTDDITVAGEGFSDITLDLAAEFTLLYSDGEDWIEVGSNHA